MLKQEGHLRNRFPIRSPFLAFDQDPDEGGTGGGSGGGDGGTGGGTDDRGTGTNDAGSSFTQADVDRIVQERIKREREKFGDYDAIKAKAKKLDELETANKSDLEKAQAENEKLKKQLELKDVEITKAKLDALKAEALQEAGLPASWAGRIQGTTDEEIKADVKALKDMIGGGSGSQNIGSGTNPPAGWEPDPSKMTMAQYAEWRAKNPNG